MGGYYGYGYGIDLSYLLLVVPALIISLIAQLRVKTTYAKYSQVYNSRGLTGESAARRILEDNSLGYIPVNPIAGTLTDHYDPASNVINLSETVYSGTSVAALGVAAHEAGHAVQYSENYAPIRLRSALVPITNIGATVSFPLILLGYFLSFSVLIYICIALFSLSVIFQLVTLPVEFNASRRAVRVLEGDGMLSQEELDGAKKVLRAAALTYVASLLVSFASLLRLVLIFGRRNNR